MRFYKTPKSQILANKEDSPGSSIGAGNKLRADMAGDSIYGRCNVKIYRVSGLRI
jgi:hypothetical protein